MEKRHYVLKAGNFKQVRKSGSKDKWTDGRWARLLSAGGAKKSFTENRGEIIVYVADGQKILYQKGWGTNVDKQQEWTANFKKDEGRFFKFK